MGARLRPRSAARSRSPTPILYKNEDPDHSHAAAGERAGEIGQEPQSEAPLMLQDKDRFKNLYGCTLGGWGSARPRRLGRHKAMVEKGHEAVIEQVKASPARPRRRGLPPGLKWSFMPKQSDGRPNYLVSTPMSQSPAPARTADIMRHDPAADRGRLPRLLRHARACFLHLYPREFIREREIRQAE